jgi:hypothetical protein
MILHVLPVFDHSGCLLCAKFESLKLLYFVLATACATHDNRVSLLVGSNPADMDGYTDQTYYINTYICPANLNVSSDPSSESQCLKERQRLRKEH